MVVFGDRIRAARTPQKFHAPNVKKYNGRTDKKIWHVNYRLAMKATSVPHPDFIIQYLPLFLTDLAIT